MKLGAGIVFQLPRSMLHAGSARAAPVANGAAKTANETIAVRTR